ncbi:unnamed protein product [Caenorhabditis auriculariae]|uniref:RNA-dependent RNA polymerase n=1 Tax=Caenorhabditis auriculariae TaxID=2777116 RepID=A0A8S1HBD7_9PELO|nr:unnamed protein product [Caenorhabditis auriculariae]
MKLWKAIPKATHSHPSRALVVNLETCNDWVRVLEWPADAKLRGFGCTQEAFAQSSWLRIDFTQNPAESELLLEVMSRVSWRSSVKLHVGSIHSLRNKLVSNKIPFASVGSFRADYVIEALRRRGSVVMDQLFNSTESPLIDRQETPLFFRMIGRAMEECSRACEESLEQLLNALDERRAISLCKAFRVMFEERKLAYERVVAGHRLQDVGLLKPLPKNCVSVPKVMVCPTQTLLMAPEVMMTNRVVRRFGAEYALRVVFRDDSGGKLAVRDFNTDKNEQSEENSIVSVLVRDTLVEGITVGDRTYHFLAWSNSQLRDQGCYMYAAKFDPEKGEYTGTIEEIRAWMGNFSTTASVPKMMSRMGQCFTQAQTTIKLEEKHWIVENDITGGVTGNYCFTDGCGKISLKFALKMMHLLKLPVLPVCFQVRFKGFKGILVIDPTIDQIVGAKKIVFRKKASKKFLEGIGGNKQEHLEVVKYSMPSPVCLNRPMITILDKVSEKQSSSSHERISRRVHYYLERELSALSGMLVNERTAAVEMSTRTNLPIDFNHLSMKCGFRITTDSFLRRMLVSIYRYNVLHHISKAKIFLPGHLGRTMYGVVDETGLLMPGQVFIQYSPSLRQGSHSKKILVEGRVLITKNPCHVPGDIRMFTAVYQPALSYLVDVVVFPQHGPRPHPDEMAGSDLDGDEYSVIWDEELYFDRNEEAMIYPNQTHAEDDTAATTQGMVDFFLKYLTQDAIGRVSNAHLISADYKGLFHEHTNSIALKCAVAVDFPKSGIPARKLTSDEQCDMAPDYMPTSQRPLYHSNSLNGQLYRKSRKIEEILEEYERKGSVYEGDYDYLICPEQYDVFQGNAHAKVSATRVFEEYARRVQQLLDEYGIEDEASIVSGHAAVIKRLAGMEKDDYSFYHTDKIVELRYSKIYESFRKKFFEEFGGEEENTVTEYGKSVIRCTPEMHEKVRQWYYVAYVAPRKGDSDVLPGRSLPWIVWEVLGELRRKLMAHQKSHVVPFVKYPMAERLKDAVEKTVLYKQEKYREFCAKLEKSECAVYLMKYVRIYNLYSILFILDEWLNEEKVFPKLGSYIVRLGCLLVQFALGIRHTTDDYVKFDFDVYFKHEKLFMEDEEEDMSQTYELGSMLLEFLQYLGSKAFGSVKYINLSIVQDETEIVPVMPMSALWVPLHLIAHRTFHAIAVSGRFDALHLTSALDGVESLAENEFISENRDPTMVRASLLDDTKDYSTLPLSRFVIIDKLKEWTGVKEIHVRNVERRSDVLLISCVGSVLARQRLSRLLLLKPEQIRSAVIRDQVPESIRDDHV